jgi:hypothetical protein
MNALYLDWSGIADRIGLRVCIGPAAAAAGPVRGRRGYAAANCAASVDPASAVVSASGAIACVTRSK